MNMNQSKEWPFRSTDKRFVPTAPVSIPGLPTTTAGDEGAGGYAGMVNGVLVSEVCTSPNCGCEVTPNGTLCRAAAKALGIELKDLRGA